MMAIFFVLRTHRESIQQHVIVVGGKLEFLVNLAVFFILWAYEKKVSNFAVNFAVNFDRTSHLTSIELRIKLCIELRIELRLAAISPIIAKL